MFQSLRWRFAVPVALFFILAVLGLSAYLIGAFNRTYLEHIQSTLRDDAHLIAAENAAQLAASPDAQALETRAKEYASTLNARVTIIRADGVVLADSEADPTSMENHASRPEVVQALSGQDAFQTRYSATLSANLLYAAVPVRQNGRVVAVVRLARPLTGIESALSQVRTVVTTAAVLSSRAKPPNGPTSIRLTPPRTSSASAPAPTRAPLTSSWKP